MDQTDSTVLLHRLQEIPDPRHKRGQSYEWRVLMGIICAALAAGRSTATSISAWAHEHRSAILAQLCPAKRRIPSLSTIRRAVVTAKAAEVEKQVTAHVTALDTADPTPGTQTGPSGQVWRGQAIDGKDVRGASAHGTPVFLVSLVRHESGYVLQQVAVREKSNEITAVPALLAGRDLRGTVTTMDALLTQRNLAQQILDQGGHYLMVVKPNQPDMWAALDLLFREPPVPREPGDIRSYTTQERGHGRLETRTLESSTALNAYVRWPGVGQVLRRTYQRVRIKTGMLETRVTYGISSLRQEQAGLPQLATFWRWHWTIENPVHYVRDETLREDRGQIHSGQGAQVLAALRNVILSQLRYQGWTNIAAACRHYGASAQQALQLIGAGAT